MEDLERQACALVRKHGWAMPKEVRDFLKKLAVQLGWNNLEREVGR